MENFQTILVFVLFGAAVAYLVYLFIGKRKKKKKCGGGDCGCES